MKKILSPAYSNEMIFIETQKYYYVIESKFIFSSFLMIIFTTLVRRGSTLCKSTLKMTFFVVAWRCSNQNRQNRQNWFDVVQPCKSQSWRTQRCFNVDLMLYDVAKSYQLKNNVEKMLKCLLGMDRFLIKAAFGSEALSIVSKNQNKLRKYCI